MRRRSCTSVGPGPRDDEAQDRPNAESSLIAALRHGRMAVHCPRDGLRSPGHHLAKAICALAPPVACGTPPQIAAVPLLHVRPNIGPLLTPRRDQQPHEVRRPVPQASADRKALSARNQRPSLRRRSPRQTEILGAVQRHAEARRRRPSRRHRLRQSPRLAPGPGRFSSSSPPSYHFVSFEDACETVLVEKRQRSLAVNDHRHAESLQVDLRTPAVRQCSLSGSISTSAGGVLFFSNRSSPGGRSQPASCPLPQRPSRGSSWNLSWCQFRRARSSLPAKSAQTISRACPTSPKGTDAGTPPLVPRPQVARPSAAAR